MQIPKRRSEENKKFGRREDDFLSAEALQALQDELTRLETVSRPRTVEELTRAREMGDLSENAAYSQAKARLAGMDRRIFDIKDRLKFAVVIKKGAGSRGEVRIGATVEVEVNGVQRVYEITGAQETNPGAGKISHHSPLGAVLMSKRAGDEIILDVGGKKVTYRIVAVK